MTWPMESHEVPPGTLVAMPSRGSLGFAGFLGLSDSPDRAGLDGEWVAMACGSLALCFRLFRHVLPQLAAFAFDGRSSPKIEQGSEY